MPDVIIHIGEAADPLEQRAAEELQRYIRALFGFTPRVSRRLPKTQRSGSRYLVLLGTQQSNPALIGFDSLGEQEYILRRHSERRLDICGGFPVAVLWGVYELIEEWGVTFLFQGDVFPEPGSVGPFYLPKLDVHRKPVFETRTARFLGDMINTLVLASVQENERILDQLCKRRINTIMGGGNSFNPWFHWSYRGVEKNTADIAFGFRHVIHERSIGKEIIGRLGHFTNPDRYPS